MGILALLIAAIAIVLLPVLAYPATPRFIGSWDEWQLFGPNNFFLDSSIHRGEFPVWNPSILCGTPFAADPQALALYPPNLIRSILTFSPTPFRTHLGITILKCIHLLVAAMGAYCLARHHRFTRTSAFLTAFVFVLSWRYLLSAFALQVLLYTTAWTPWLLFAMYSAFDAKDLRARVRNCACAGLLFTLVLLGGYPQVAVYIVVGAAVALALHAAHDILRAPKPAAARCAGVLLGTFALGVACSSALLLPAAELGPLSTRGLDSVLERERSDLLFWQGVPWLFDVIIVLTGVGAGAVLLALVGLAARPSKFVAIYAVFLYLMLDFAMGPPFPASTVLGYAAPFQFSFYIYALHLVPLPIGLLAGAGLDALRTAHPKRARRLIATGGIVAAGIFCAQSRLTPSFFWVEAKLFDIVPSLLLMSLLVACLFARRRDALITGAVALVFIELWMLDWRHIEKQYAPESMPYPGTLADLKKTSTALNTNRRESRDTPLENTVLLDGVHGIGGYNALILARSYAVLSDPLYEGSYWRSIGGQAARSNAYWWLFLKRRFWLVSRYSEGPLPGKDRFFPCTTTVYLDGPARPEQIASIARDAVPDTGVSEAAHSTPIVVHRTETSDNEFCVDLSQLASPDVHAALAMRYRSNTEGTMEAHIETGTTKLWLPSRPIIDTGGGDAWLEFPLPDDAAGLATFRANMCADHAHIEIVESVLRRDLADENEHITIRDAGADSVSLRVTDLPSYRLLVFVEAQYPGWSASIDGKPAPILPANEAFMAVELPPGTHDVTFAFRSATMCAGVVISGIGAVLALLAIGVTVMPRRTEGHTHEQ